MSSLPFLMKPKRQDAGVIMKVRESDEKPEESNDFDELEECAKDLISAMEQKNAKAIADAFHAMFQVCEERPHDEVDHEAPAPHSYDASKE